jgi:hypothetical protein
MIKFLDYQSLYLLFGTTFWNLDSFPRHQIKSLFCWDKKTYLVFISRRRKSEDRDQIYRLRQSLVSEMSFQIKDTKMDHVQKIDHNTNIPSPRTFRMWDIRLIPEWSVKSFAIQPIVMEDFHIQAPQRQQQEVATMATVDTYQPQI